ncbi:MAG: pseudouridine-5-phosphate glycosidase [Chloroflexi bacterium HGW-Chloroflexi-2]|jgi:pseudouridine-5'-phosphate glycosidase|nr:MAG: pseudouridine-5-phosphate glycosidase [Chloroflexi bacterium HGW-Chloroflexi-2]
MMKVALESTVITHGLPYPQNVETALSMENIVRENSGVPVTIGVLAGKIKIGMTADEIERMAKEENVFKAGVRELSIMLAQKRWASTTVSATARLAYLNKIHVFATGGIGGVHPGPWDVSMDLMELSRTPIVVVSAGPKAILDLPGTYEILETIGVTVVGYQVDEMPAFYSRSSGIGLPRANDPAEIAEMLMQSRKLGLTNAILVFNPIPAQYEISNEEVERWKNLSNQDLADAGVSGKQVTPFLLARMAHHSEGRTVKSNRSLLENNVLLATQIGHEIEKMTSRKIRSI